MSQFTSSDGWMFILSVICMVGMMYCAAKLNEISNGQAMYDCSIAEISPNIPAKVKEECRRLKANIK